MKSNLDQIQEATKAMEEAINGLSSIIPSVAQNDKQSARDISNLLMAFRGGNDAVIGQMANDIINKNTEILKNMDNARGI